MGQSNIHRPSQSLSLERIAALEPGSRDEWTNYWQRSRCQGQVDRRAFADECDAHQNSTVATPPVGRFAESIPLDKPLSWYRSDEAVRLGKHIVSFQTPAGGWSKNLDFSDHLRRPGEHYTACNPSPEVASSLDAFEGDPHWHYVGTFDNNATISQVRFLAKLITALGASVPAEFLGAFHAGVEFLLRAQFPCGGWPQVWPLEGGYHDCITFNDDAVTNILNLLFDIVAGQFEFSFVHERLRKRCGEALNTGVGCVVNTQITNSRCYPAVWCQQYDPITLLPSPGRKFEIEALCSAESAGLACFLMRLPNPAENIARAIRGAIEWFGKTVILDREFKSGEKDGRNLVSSPGSGPIWSRFYDLSSETPVFADRDGHIYHEVSLVPRERRDGYLWFSKAPRRALREYGIWIQRWG
jgi:PelA/Pel-15E family pectate lyase